MPLPDKEDIKCFGFIAIIILVIIFGTFYYHYVIRFVLMVFFYWFISIPSIIIAISSADFISRKIMLKKSYLTINNVDTQEVFRRSTGENPLRNGKMTKSYKHWLIKKVEIPKYKFKYRAQVSPNDINGLILLVIFLVAMSLIVLAIYASIFPDYRVPLAW